MMLQVLGNLICYWSLLCYNHNYRVVMKSQHVDPEEAVQIHQDTHSHNSLGIHWGTFTLTYEVRNNAKPPLNHTY